MHVTGYRCLACGADQPAAFNGFVCPECGGNLDIAYDHARARDPFMAALEGGRRDMFRYAPLLPGPNGATSFPLHVGGTPLYEAGRLGELAGLKRLYLKDETGNPSASLKDRAGAVALMRAMQAGAEVVAVASTGNAGSSLACLAAALGVRAVVFVPASAPAAKLAQLLSYGATVLAVRGGYDDAYDLCLQASQEFGWFNRSTGFNPYTREGKKTWVFETWEALGRQVPDRVLVPSGDGNILSATWKGWLDLRATGLTRQVPKLDCVQSSASDAICRTVRRLRAAGRAAIDWSRVAVDEVHAATIADSIAVNRPRDGLAAVRAVIESEGAAVTVEDGEILAAIPELARHTGIFAEPAAAAPWAALKQMAGQGLVEPDERIVCLVSGSGLKDAARAAQAAGEPLLIDPQLAAVTDALRM